MSVSGLAVRRLAAGSLDFVVSDKTTKDVGYEGGLCFLVKMGR